MTKKKKTGPQTVKRRARQFVVVLTQEEKGWYSATCPTLPGCHSPGKGIE